ncbi:outer membrane protein assembly factor BamB family protein [Haloarcula sp. CGMCC 1.2071]|uniref:outer membrane protein assembly factor BamB family protein n=1 Tax=Haloarcula sp. CGMCC 1.2071 TaxID=3111454 RepID=UPI00300EFAB1
MDRREFISYISVAGTSGCLRMNQTESDTEDPTNPQADRISETAQSTESIGTAENTQTDIESSTTEPNTTEPETEEISFSKVWEIDTGLPLIFDTAVYGRSGMMDAAYAIDIETGNTIWEKSGITNSGELIAKALGVGDSAVLYRVSADSGDYILALSQDDGTTLWKSTVDGQVYSRFLVTSDAFIANINDPSYGNSAVVGLDPDTGERLWQIDSGLINTGGTRRLGTVNGSGSAYVLAGTNSNSAQVSKINPETGDHYWKWTEKTPVSPPRHTNGMVYVGMYQQFSAINASTGKTEWTTSTSGQCWTRSVIHDGKLIFGTRSSDVYALSLESGEQQWRFQTDGQINTVAGSDTGYIFAGTDNGSVYVLRGTDGQYLEDFSVEGAIEEMVVASGHLLVNTDVPTMALSLQIS